MRSVSGWRGHVGGRGEDHNWLVVAPQVECFHLRVLENRVARFGARRLGGRSASRSLRASRLRRGGGYLCLGPRLDVGANLFLGQRRDLIKALALFILEPLECERLG